ncbi:MAG: hypothetical protein JST86_03090 [Bacteroidetes bacterium]|nr:hypothetical protein [Bacteroidota bacterium]
MRKYLAPALMFLFKAFAAQSQTIDSALIINANNFPQEKIHLHTDREAYLPGETVWFKAYVMADDLPSTISTNFYADLFNASGILIEHKIMPMVNASADGFFTLPDTTAAGYTIKAYTAWMLNFDTAFVYTKTIGMLGTNSGNATAAATPATLRFFAEGGNFVAGLYNYVAFKAVLDNGAPYEVTGVVRNSRNEMIDTIITQHDGMGLLKFIPEAGEAYTAEWKDNAGVWRKTSLPAVEPQGIVLHAEKVGRQLFYQVSTTTNTGNLAQLTVMATMNQRPVYSAKIAMKENAVTDKINTVDFPSGVLQLSVLNQNNQPVAERILFINNNNYVFGTTLKATEKSIEKRGKNVLQIDVADTLAANLSLAVYDAAAEQQSSANIYTDLLLQGDLRGTIYNAGWYFEDSATNAAAYLDLVMQTNGWRRYNWNRIIAMQPPVLSYPKDNYLSIYGRVTDAKPANINNQVINIIIQSKDSARQWHIVNTNNDGEFTKPGLVFYDTATISYKLNDSKNKTSFTSISGTYNGTIGKLPFRSIPAWLTIPAEITAKNEDNSQLKKLIQNATNKFEKDPKLLGEVKVKSRVNWKNDPMQKMDEKYTKMFGGVGAMNTAIDVLHDEMASGKGDIFNYMIGKIPTLTVKNAAMVKSFFDITRQSAPVYFLNESIIDADFLQNINIDNIAYIKYYPYANWMSGMPPALCIYEKKQADKDSEWQQKLRDMPGNLSRIKIAGYSPAKEFYSPDYSTADAKNNKNADIRTTLLWQPNIITNKSNQSVPVTFYNNDVTHRFRIILEGVNEAGKLVHIEKVVE